MLKKNVLYIGGFELPDKNAAAQRVISNGKLLSTIGYKVTFIGVNKDVDFKQGKREELLVDEFLFFSKPQRYPSTKKEWIHFITDISFVKETIITDFDNKVDLIIVYNYPAYTLKKLQLICKKLKIKIVADVTEWYNPQGGLVYRLIKSLDSFARMMFFHKQLNGIIAISRYLENYYKDSISTIMLPPLVDRNSQKWNVFYDKISSGRIKLIYVGSPGIGKKDKLDLVIHLLSLINNRIKDFEFTIIGITKKQYFESFEVDSIPKNISNKIIFKGRIPHESVMLEIIKSDFSIFLREKNLVNTAGFPTKFVESITCGIPVLTNSTSNIEEFLKNEELGIILNDKNEYTLMQSFERVLNFDIKRIERMKFNCSNSKRFDYKFYLEKLENFINSL